MPLPRRLLQRCRWQPREASLAAGEHGQRHAPDLPCHDQGRADLRRDRWESVEQVGRTGGGRAGAGAKSRPPLNSLGLIEVTKTFLPMLGAIKNSTAQGKIINISSVAGRSANPFVAPYSASKFALEGFSDALRRELLLYGVDVILVEPGPIKTAIWDKVPDQENNEFTGTDYEPALRKFYTFFIEMGKKGFDAGIIGNKVKDILQNPSPKTRYVITPNRFAHFTLPNLLPDRMFDKLDRKSVV